MKHDNGSKIIVYDTYPCNADDKRWERPVGEIFFNSFTLLLGSKIDNLLLRKRLGHNIHFYCLLFRWCKNIGLSQKLLQKRNFCVSQKKHKRPNEKEYLFYPGLVGFSGIMEVGRRWWWCWFYCWWERTVIILVLMIDALPSISPTRLSLVLC